MCSALRKRNILCSTTPLRDDNSASILVLGDMTDNYFPARRFPGFCAVISLDSGVAGAQSSVETTGRRVGRVRVL